MSDRPPKYFVCLITRRAAFQQEINGSMRVETSIEIIVNPLETMDKILSGEFQPTYCKSSSSSSSSSSVAYSDVGYALIIGPIEKESHAQEIKRVWKKCRGHASKIGAGMFLAQQHGLSTKPFYSNIFYNTPKDVIIQEVPNSKKGTDIVFLQSTT